MEHVIQIGVSVDDEAIQKQIIASAETKIVAEIKSQVEETIFRRKNYYGSTRTELSEVGAQVVREWLDENSDKIISMAANTITDKVYRSKAWKAKYGEVTADD